MPSVFDLKTSSSDLRSSNDGVGKMQFEQVMPTRSVTGDSFASGQIRYNIEVPSGKWWLPSQTYLSMRYTLSADADGNTDVSVGNEIAPAYFAPQQCFQAAEFRAGGKTICKVADHLGAIQALQYRQNKSAAWVKSVGKSVTCAEPSFSKRRALVCSDASNHRDDAFPLADISSPNSASITWTKATRSITFAGTTTGHDLLPAHMRYLAPGRYIAIDEGTAGRPLVKILSVHAHAGTPLRNVTVVVEANSAYDDIPDGADLKTTATFLNVGRHYTDAEDVSTWDISKRRNQEFCFQLPLSIFNVAHAMPGGSYEFILTPKPTASFKLSACQQLPHSQTALTNAAIHFKIDGLIMYLPTLQGPRMDEGSFFLDLTSVTVATEKVRQIAMENHSFEVPSSTHALTFALQDTRCEGDPRISSSFFQAYDDTTALRQDLKMNRYYIQYRGVQYPSPESDASYSDTHDHMTQRYLESQFACGGWMDRGGAESLNEWKEYGALYHYKTPSDPTDRSTTVSLNHSFAGGTAIANMQVMLFAHYKTVAAITVKSGKIYEVVVEDV